MGRDAFPPKAIWGEDEVGMRDHVTGQSREGYLVATRGQFNSIPIEDGEFVEESPRKTIVH